MDKAFQAKIDQLGDELFARIKAEHPTCWFDIISRAHLQAMAAQFHYRPGGLDPVIRENLRKAADKLAAERRAQHPRG